MRLTEEAKNIIIDNLNIFRKLSLNVLKLIEIGNKALSLKKKRFAIGTNPEKHLEHIISL